MTQPNILTVPFAESAAPQTIQEIPISRDPSDPIQKASWSTGFPAATMQPLATGGVPPMGQDFNGILKALSEHIVYMGSGGLYRWSDAWVAAKGGYPLGAVLQSNDGRSAYVNIVEGNAVNFNTTPSSIGVSWLPFAGNGALSGKVDKTTQVIAGTGLSGGGDLSTNRTLSVNYGTTSTTAARGDDSRITGALQKSSNLGDLPNRTTARVNLGLGSSSTRDVGTNSGNVMEVGAFGLGLTYPNAPTLNGAAPSSFFNAQGDAVPNEWGQGGGANNEHTGGIVLPRDGRPTALYFGNRLELKMSRYNGITWTSGVEFYHSGNFNPDTKVNTTTQVIAGTGLTGGGTLAANRTLAINSTHWPLGMGQTWQDMTGSRVDGTTYTNTTGRPIYVMIQINDWGAGGVLVVNGISANRHDDARAGDTVSMVIPNGATYSISGATISKWLELR